MRKLHPEGFFEVVLPGIGEIAPAPSSYRIRFRTEYDEIIDHYDTYAFPFLLTEFDLYLMGEGRHYDAYGKLGAHIKTGGRRDGRAFCGVATECAARHLWRFRPLGRPREPDAVSWFVGDLGIVFSGVDEGTIYKFEIVGKEDVILPLKRTPMPLLRSCGRMMDRWWRASTSTRGETPHGWKNAGGKLAGAADQYL